MTTIQDHHRKVAEQLRQLATRIEAGEWDDVATFTARGSEEHPDVGTAPAGARAVLVCLDLGTDPVQVFHRATALLDPRQA